MIALYKMTVKRNIVLSHYIDNSNTFTYGVKINSGKQFTIYTCYINKYQPT